MATVQTARGPVDSAQLGATLTHEHVIIRDHSFYDAWPHLWDRTSQIANAVQMLTDLKAAGIDTLIDLTTVDLGRAVEEVAEIARQVGLHILMCTGAHLHPPRALVRLGADRVADLWVRDIEQGLSGTTMRAANIKLATEAEIDEANEVMLRAGARAHRRTGVPINTHSSAPAGSGLKQQDIFEQEGVDLSRVLIGHSGDTEDVAYLAKIMDRGSVIGMDRFGIDAPLMPHAGDRVGTVARLCQMGYADRMTLSHDAWCYHSDIDQQRIDAIAPNHHFRYVPQTVVPALRARGVSEAQIRQMLVDNPRRLFERQGAY